MNNFINNIAYLERIFETLDEPVTIADKEDAEDMGEISGQVSFNDVTFAYEEGVNVLEHVSFDVKPRREHSACRTHGRRQIHHSLADIPLLRHQQGQHNR